MRLVQCVDCQQIAFPTQAGKCQSCGSNAVSYTIYLSPVELLSRQQQTKIAYCTITNQPES